MATPLGLDERIHDVHVITGEQCIRGVLRVKGMLEVILNSEDRFTLSLMDAYVQALDKNSTASAMSLARLALPKPACQLITFAQQPSEDDLMVKPVEIPSVVYTAYFAIQGVVRVGGVEHLADMLDGVRGYFFPVFSPRLYPLVPMWAVIPKQSAVVLVNKHHVRMLHEAAP